MAFDSRLVGYLSQGTAASRPAAPNAATNTLSFYFATDTETLSFYDWNDVAWQDVATSAGLSAATTTEQLTGTSTTVASTPDSVAALWEKGSDIVSAATISIGEGGFFHVTGTTTITDIDFGVDKTGRTAILVFDGALTLTHNATTLILPSAANITTVAGDCAIFVSEGTDAVRCIWYSRASGAAIVSTSFSGAMVKKSADQLAADYTATPSISFDAEIEDIGGWHDNVTNNSRLTVPSGVTRVQIGVNVRIQNFGDNVVTLFIKKNASDIFDGATGLTTQANASSHVISIVSGPLVVTPGDYFEVFLFISTDTSVDIIANRTNFWIRSIA